MSQGAGIEAITGVAPACLVLFASVDSLEPWHFSLLDDVERGRLDVLRREEDRDRFTLATALLRCYLGVATKVGPALVEIDRTCPECGRSHGRPRLPRTGLHASISHSGRHVAVAVCIAGPVGVDIEATSGPVCWDVLDTVCAPSERPHVRTADDFYTCWTRKESVLKAMGVGLTVAMSDLIVSPPATKPAVTSYVGMPLLSQMRDITPGAGYAGAVAVLCQEPLTFVIDSGESYLQRADR